MGQLAVALSAKLNTPKKPLLTEQRSGISFPRYFTARLDNGRTPYDEIQWERRTASIGNDKGAVIFEQRDVEIPKDWSQTATNIVASKYFHGKMGSPRRCAKLGGSSGHCSRSTGSRTLTCVAAPTSG